MVTLQSFACHAAVTRASRRHLGSVDATFGALALVEWSARLLAYSMRPSGVSRYVIVGVSSVLFRHAPSLADRRLRGCVINHYAVEWSLVKGLTNFQRGGFQPGPGQAGFGATPRREPEAAAGGAASPSESRERPA